MTPLGPLEARPYRFEQKYCPNRLCEISCTSSKNEFVCLFLGKIRGYQKSFRNYLTFSRVCGVTLKRESVQEINDVYSHPLSVLKWLSGSG